MRTAPGKARSRRIRNGGRSIIATSHTVLIDSWSMSSRPSPAHSDTRIEPITTATFPLTAPAPFSISVPMTGTELRAESMRSSRSSSLFASTRPNTLTNASSSGKSEKKPL